MPKNRKNRKSRKSKKQLEKKVQDSRERMSTFLQKKDEERAEKDSLARKQALERLGITQEFNHADHAEIYNYSAEVVEAPIETVDGSIPPPEVTHETLDEGRLPQAPTEEPIVRQRPPRGSKRAIRFMRTKAVLKMQY
jgi:hypothetical protein